MNNMKKLILLLSLINILAHVTAQTKSIIKVDKPSQWVGVKLTTQYNGLTNKGFDALNNELQKNQINALPTEFTTSGVSLYIWANKIGFEFAFHTIESKLEKTDKFTNSGIPFLSGQHLKFACFTDIFKRKRFKIGTSVGLSTNALVFEIVDLQPQPNTFGNLLTNPSLSRTIAFESSKMLMLEGALGFDYQLVRSEKIEFTIGMKAGYNYQPLKQKRFLKWTTKRTNILIDNFPLVSLDSYFIQFNTALNFNLN
jgi:hypothetical protein